MAEIILANPRRRKRRKNPRRRRAMSALQRKYFGGGRRKRHSNPRRRRRHRNPSHRHHRARRRRNPSLRGVTGALMPTLKAGAVGAAGAIGLDLLWGYGASYLPASIAGSPIAQYGVKLLGALGVGILGGKVLRGRGRDLAVGATTVVLHDAFKAQLKASFPTLQLGEYLTYAPTVGRMPRAGRVLSTGLSGVGEYLSGLPNAVDNSSMEYNGGEYSADGMSGGNW